MISDAFKPVDAIEQNWLLNVDPSKSQNDKIQDRMEQFNFKMSTIMLVIYMSKYNNIEEILEALQVA